MADTAIGSLEYWLTTIKLDKLQHYYSLILSKFDDYLQINRSVSAGDAGQQTTDNASAASVHEKILTLQLEYKGRGRRKLPPVKLFERSSTQIDGGDLYEQIQLRILKILGQLAGEMSHSLFEATQQDQMIAWDTTSHLRFYVPFVDIKPAIYFDRILPRIVYLALSSTNRQTKVNACELLHSIVVFMIGKSVSDPKAATATTTASSSYQLNRSSASIRRSFVSHATSITLRATSFSRLSCRLSTGSRETANTRVLRPSSSSTASWRA